MPTLFTKYNSKNWFPEHNVLREYLSFDLSLEEQMQAIEQKAKELGEIDAFEVALHKHLLAVTALLEAQAMISNDDHRKYLDEPAEWLNRTTREVFGLSHDDINEMNKAFNYTKNMRYSDFTFPYLKKNYGIEQAESNLFAKREIVELKPSARLQEDLEDAKEIPVMTEKAKSEVIIYPILREMKKVNPHINFFSGYSLHIETEEKLTGKPDFMIVAHPNKIQPKAPIFCLVEAKNALIEEGYAQCAAEMYAAKLFNQENDEPYDIIYGAVTNAYDWVFLKLEGNTVFIDTERYFLNDLAMILGILQYIIDQVKTLDLENNQV